MALGGFNPLPLALGGTAETGWRAVQHSRCADDLLSHIRTCPFAVLSVTISGGAATVASYLSVHGVGTDHAPTVTRVTTGTITVEWPASVTDQYDIATPVNIKAVMGAPNWTGSGGGTQVKAYVTAPNKVAVYVYTIGGSPALADRHFTLVVWSPDWSNTTSIDAYDGATDKEDSLTEGDQPYAATFYLELRDNLRGSAYSKQDTGLLHCENLALARLHAGLARLSDKQRNNTLPMFADDKLQEWITAQHILVRPGDTREKLRKRCASQFQATLGPTRQVFDDAVQELLGDLFVQVWRSEPVDLSDPPDHHYWPGINPGPSSYDIGGGAWYSEVCQVIVEINYPHGIAWNDFRDLVDAQLFQLSHRLLPVWATCKWSYNASGGFILDVDELDLAALTE